MTDVKQLITEHLDIWLTAETEKKSGRGRSSGSKDTIYGVQKLRELILDLAISGKLVPQFSTDESVHDLLKKIAIEKKETLNNKKFKKRNVVANSDSFFAIPKTWEWCYLEDYSLDIHYGYTASSNENLQEFRLLRITDIQNDKVNWDTVPGCEITCEQADQYLLRNGDILIARTGGTIGKSYLVENLTVKSVFASYLIRVKNLESSNSKYIKTYLGSQIYWKQLYANSMGTGQPNVNGNALKKLIFPLPPLEEQQRIVEKVDELMQLCDQLEQQQSLSSDAHATLVDTLLKALTESSDADEFQGNWQRIVANFDVLFTMEYSIEQLKQTVLQLAVMGKLVKQDPSDEPASELLKKIADEKAKLIKDGKIKKSKPLPEITEDEKLFALPSGWQWSRLNNIVSILGDGLHGTPEYEDNTGLYFINGNNLNDGVIEIKDHTKTVSKASFEKNKKDLCLRTIFVSINGTIGNVAFYNNEPVILGKSACYFNMIEPTSLLFMKLVFNSPYFFDYAEKSVTSTTIKNLSLASMNKFPIPLPPLNEQRLIVKKVNQLFSMIDQLQVLQSKLQKTKLHLADALVANAVEGV